MANIRSAEKQRRQAEKANERNRAVKSRLRNQIKRARKAIEEGAENVGAVMSETFSTIDRAAKKKVIKTNTADRYKSRLAGAQKRTATAAK